MDHVSAAMENEAVRLSVQRGIPLAKARKLVLQRSEAVDVTAST